MVLEPASGPLAVRLLEDRVLKLETVADALADQHDVLRTEMRREIMSLRDQMRDLENKMEEGNRIVNSKLDRLLGERAVVTGLITLVTSVLGTGVVHIALSMGTH
ncbi:hypothetical protein [Kozakia baliensis]|uniref:hypothetical protein n=1 Tax=Kozakia baliensis TaxID=153496 RepID=UPI00116DF2FD|nr:hypothetical protein [Kozakia baliensis]GBR23114.1 hypothetical protein AA0488_0053 [Kozakia baliensis NRIC 0488]GEL65126.1 hypothetical protein KBA01_24120 [Kozakia baliensis]